MFSSFSGIFALSGRPLSDKEVAHASNQLALGRGECALSHDARALLFDEQWYLASQNTPSAVGSKSQITAGIAGWIESEFENEVEFVIKQYQERGVRSLTELYGDFAIALADSTTGDFFLVSDLVGSQPIYYSIENERLIFAPEIASLLRYAPKLSQTVDEGFVAEYLSGYIYDRSATPYEKIRRLPAGSYLRVRNARIQIVNYFDPRNISSIALRSADSLAESLRELLRHSIASRITGRKFACELSGGIDSASIIALINDSERGTAQSPELTPTFSLTFPGLACDESHFVTAFRGKIPTAHQSIVPSKLSLAEYATRAQESGGPPDTPLAYAAEELRKRAVGSSAEILLTGLGGDELFGQSFSTDDSNTFEWLTSRLPLKLKSRVKRYLGRTIQPPPWLSRNLAKRVGFQERAEKLPFALYGIPNFRREKCDFLFFGWAQHQTSLEYQISRRHRIFSMHPLRDRKVIEFVLGLPPETFLSSLPHKFLLREAVKGITPESIRNRSDKGDYSIYLDSELKRLFPSRNFTAPTLVERGWIDPKGLETLVQQAFKPKAAQSDEHQGAVMRLWHIVALETWSSSGLNLANFNPTVNAGQTSEVSGKRSLSGTH